MIFWTPLETVGFVDSKRTAIFPDHLCTFRGFAPQLNACLRVSPAITLQYFVAEKYHDAVCSCSAFYSLRCCHSTLPVTVSVSRRIARQPTPAEHDGGLSGDCASRHDPEHGARSSAESADSGDGGLQEGPDVRRLSRVSDRTKVFRTANRC